MERENTELKYKENILDIEILKMKSKIKRIEEMFQRHNRQEAKKGLGFTVPAEAQR